MEIDDEVEVNDQTDNTKGDKLDNNKKIKKLQLNEKILAITIAKSKGNQVAAKWAGVSTKSIRNWIKKENEIKNANNLFKKTLHPGKPKFQIIEEKLYDFVCFNKALGNPVTTWSLVLDFNRLNKNEDGSEIDNIKKLQNRIYRFYKRYGLTIRKPTHVGRAIYKQAELTLSLYISEVLELKKIYHFYDDLICNIDETPLVFNLVPNKVVAMKGEKSIIIKTMGQEKVHCTVLLGILSNGTDYFL